MKKFTKGLLTMAVLAAMSLMAAEDTTILVTTFDDEDGENPSKCSLREAVTAASTHQPYGGCPKGDRYASNVKKIQLEAGTYLLKRELTPNSPLYIIGKEPADFTRPNTINNDYPAKTPLKTTISGQGSSRLFNTINLEKPSLTLENIVLADGYNVGAGGALLLGGNAELINVVIQGSKADKGGAIFLNDINSHLTITGSVLKDNKAVTGSVLAMTCLDGLNYTTRNIAINRSSIIANGDANSQSTLAYCGQPTALISTSTISKNIANSNTGRIIEFSGFTGATLNNLSPNSSLGLLSNSIVENTASTALLYDATAKKTLNYNILAFNSAKSCKYNSGDIATVNNANIETEKNAMNLSNADCELPKTSLDYAIKNSVDINGLKISDLLSSLQIDQEYTDFLPMYFPLEKTGLSLIDAGGNGGCSEFDQRGIKRALSSQSTTASMKSNSCDIGSTEVLHLTVQNITDTNKSVTGLISNYQANYDLFNDLINNKETKPELLKYYQLRRDEFSNLIQYTQSDQKYRTIFIDPFTANMPDELVVNGARQIQHLNPDNYEVSVVRTGVGKLGSDGLFIGQDDTRLKCTWNSNLKQIMLYREDDRVTADSDFEVCQYTLKNKQTSKSASAYILGRFTNIAPVVPEKLDITIDHGGTQSVSIDLLKGANDDGDGLVSTLTNSNKSAFFLNPQGQTQAIRITNLPDPIAIRADRSGPCPNLDSKYTCYGGNVTLQLKNTLDVFSYKVDYVVYDADGAPSGTGKIHLNNTATAPGSVRSNGGGGSISWFTLLGLAGLLGYRARQVSRRH